MEFINKLALGSRFLYAKIFKKRIPFQVYIRLTERCNRNCSYCKGDYLVKNKKEITTQQFIKIIDEFVKLGTKRFTLFGGEPLLRQDIKKIAQRIKNHGASCSVITNGSLIGQQEELLEKINLLTVSLDGNKECHDAYRGKGSYREALYAIK